MARNAGSGLLPANRVRRVRLVLLGEVVVALVLAIFVHPLLLAFLLLPVLELVIKPVAHRRQVLGLRS